MAATTISRATWTDGASGTVLANARLQADIYDKIDALIGANINFGGTLGTEGFGTHLFSAGGTGANRIRVRNTSAGTTHSANLEVGTDANAALGELMAFSSTYTTDTAAGLHASGITLRSNGSGGLNLVCTSGPVRFHASGNLRASIDTTHGILAENTFGLKIKNTGGNQIDGVVLTSGNQINIGSDNAANVNDTVIAAGGDIRFRSNSAERMVMTSGGLLQVANGSAASPSHAFLSDTDTGFYLGGGISTTAISVAVAGAKQVTFEGSFLSGGFGDGPSVHIPDGAYGTGGVSGGYIQIGRNTSGNTSAGTLRLVAKGGQTYSTWVDASGNLRIGNGIPPWENGTNSDTGGTVVGTQTSSRHFKRNITPYTDKADALRIVCETPLFRFHYKAGHGIQGEDFMGIITDDSPEFGMDRDEEHPGGKSLNVANAIGLLVACVQAQQQQIEALKHGR